LKKLQPLKLFNIEWIGYFEVFEQEQYFIHFFYDLSRDVQIKT